LLGRGLKRHNTSIEQVEAGRIDALLSDLNLPDMDAVYYEIGLGNHIPSVIAAWLLNEGTEHDVEVEQPMELPSETDPGPLIVEGGEDAIISLARCCMPIHGDHILGMITAGKGVLVHRTDCQNVSRQRRRSREWVSVVWGADTHGLFQTSMVVEIDNVPGALARVANVMSEMDTNIEDIRFERSSDNVTTMTFTLSVTGRVQLGRLIKRVRSLKAVLRVRRATA